jgi:tripartite-type tricarboxylate transporter receptor subunit TctC
MKRGFYLTLVVAFGLVMVLPSSNPAQTFPEKPISLIVPFPAGGAPDIFARALVEAVKNHLPKPVAVINRPGGAGTIGISELIQSPHDGYKIGLGAVALFAVHPHMTPLPYRTPDDYLAVMKLGTLQVTFFARSDAPWKDAKEMIDYARTNPGKLKVGVPGLGTILHLDYEHLKLLAKIDLTTVPFEGPHQIPALLGGHVDLALAHPAPILPHVKAGKIKVLGVFQHNRNPLFPDAPTFKEIGYDITLGVYYSLILPKGTPQPVVRVLHDAFKKALEEPSFVALMKKSSVDVDYRGSEVVTKELWQSYEQCGKLVDYLGLKKK